jgi:hypothetical protein
MLNRLQSLLNIPKECFLNRKLFKKHFYDNYQFTSSDKKLFKLDIKKITWLYSLKPENTNIPEFVDNETEFSEIAYIMVEVGNTDKISRIVEIIHRSIPYGTILFLTDLEKIVISTSLKRFNKLSRESIIVDEIISIKPLLFDESTSLINTLGYDLRNDTNLKEYYMSFVRELLAHITMSKIGCVAKRDISPKEHKIMLDQIDEYEKAINSLKKNILLETQISKKVDMNVEIKNIETLMFELKKQVS